MLAAIDERVLIRAIKWKYHGILESDYGIKEKNEEKENISNILSREYMDKLFLSGIKLGVLTENERVEIFDTFSSGKYDRATPRISREEESKEVVDLDIRNKSDITSRKSSPKKKEGVKEEYDLLANKYELSFEEQLEIKEILKRFEDATPRQIRVFYYRYLLARNLLNVKLKAINEKMWPEYDDHSILSELLLKFSCSGSEKIKEEKDRLIKSKEETCELLLFNGSYTGNRKTVLEILTVLETVVAY